MNRARPAQPSVQLALKRASFRVLLQMWPDVAVIARDLGLPYSTVATWVRRDNVPQAHWDTLTASARARGLHGVTATRCRQIEAERRRRGSSRIGLDSASPPGLRTPSDQSDGNPVTPETTGGTDGDARRTQPERTINKPLAGPDTPAPAARKDTTMPLDQAASNGLSPDAKASWMRQYQTQKRRCAEETGVLRNIVKRAKADGMPIKAMIDAVAASKLDPDEVVRDLRDTIELMTIKRIPISREDLFNWDVELTVQSRQDDDLWDAEDAGYRAGRGGNTIDDCPYPAGSELHVGWTAEWHKGQAAIARELGGDAKPASASRQRPRRARQVDLPLTDDAKPMKTKRARKGGTRRSANGRRAPEGETNSAAH